MKTVFCKSLLNVLVICAVTAWAQGPLAPAGAPAPGMKTLAQVEPRTAITTPGYTITQPGSYYLATNLVTAGSASGVSIQATNVTLDLNGFAIMGFTATGNGIMVDGSLARNVVIRNGMIQGCYYHGINANTAMYCTFENLHVDRNGRYSDTYDGLRAGAYCRVTQCRISGNGGDGLSAGQGAVIRDNICSSNGASGAGAGIHVTATDGLVENNTVMGNDYGLDIDAENNQVAGNVVCGNGSNNYVIAKGNQLNLLLCEVPETIYWPASIRFAGTLTCHSTATNGITVMSDDVTIDLAGHTLVGPGASSRNGIYQPINNTSLTVMNGNVRNWRGASWAGIYANGQNNRISSVQALSNHTGILAFEGSVIQTCGATKNLSSGIYASGAVIKNCAATYNGGNGIWGNSGCSISDCTAYGNAGDGISGSYGCTIHSCAAELNKLNGISANFGGNIHGCSAENNTGDGISLNAHCQAVNNTCKGNGFSGNAAGIHAQGAGNRIDSNHVSGNTRGIDVDDIENLVVRNSASDNGTDYSIAAGNHNAQVLTPGAGFVATNPWANFSL